VLPPNEVAAAFTNQVRLIVAQVVASIHQARTLANLRDTLLPKLMSGEMRVGHAEQLIVEVSR
jgi:type I restriction enzyme S subunit